MKIERAELLEMCVSMYFSRGVVKGHLHNVKRWEFGIDGMQAMLKKGFERGQDEFRTG